MSTTPRTTQVIVNALDLGDSAPRTTQVIVNALWDEVGPAAALATQALVNVLDIGQASAFVTQTVVNALYVDSLDNDYVSQTCLLVRIARRDGTVQRFASLDRDVTWGGETWTGSAPVDPMAVESARTLAAGQTEFIGLISATAIRSDDLLNGIYDDAEIRISRVDWANPERGAIVLFEGRLAVAQIGEGQFSAEVRLPSARLEVPVVDQYTPECRVDLFSAPCGVNPAGFTETHTITAALSRTRLAVPGLTQPADWAAYGILTITSGANNGAQREIRAQDALGNIDIWDPFAAPVLPGTTCTITAGCDKRRTTCAAKFANVLNFRGFPDVPGEDRLFQTPNAR